MSTIFVEMISLYLIGITVIGHPAEKTAENKKKTKQKKKQNKKNTEKIE